MLSYMSRASVTYAKSCVNNPILAIFLVMLMTTSGCIGLADEDKDEHELIEIDFGDITKRSIGSPNLKYIPIVGIGKCTEDQYRRRSGGSILQFC